MIRCKPYTMFLAVLAATALPGVATLCRAAVTLPPAPPATAHASQPATQAAPASQPAAPALEPKAVVQIFLTGIFSGDEKAVFDNLAYTSDDARAEAQAVIGEAIAQQQLGLAMTQAFAGAPGKPTPEQQAKAMIDDVKKQLATAKVTEKEETAEVSVDPSPTIALLRDKGVWKIDFAKTQRLNKEDRLDKAALAETAAHAKVFREMTADVKAGKFKTADEANDELSRRLAPAAASTRRAPAATVP